MTCMTSLFCMTKFRRVWNEAIVLCNIFMFTSEYVLSVVDDNNLKNGRKPVKIQKESPAGCAVSKQSEGN